MPGFNNDLAKRNAYLESRGVQSPGFTKTGTTIAGVIFKVYTELPRHIKPRHLPFFAAASLDATSGVEGRRGPRSRHKVNCRKHSCR